MFRFIFAFVLLVATCFPLHASHQESGKKQLYWLIWDLSPEFINHGPQAGQGYADKFLAYFTQRMPEYDHHIQPLNVKRWNIEAHKPNHCTPHVWGDFFPDSTILSKPYTLTAPHVLIFHKRYQHRFGPAGSTLSLERLLKAGDLRMFTLPVFINNDKKQSRYPVLNPIMKPYIGSPQLTQLSGNSNQINLKVLSQKRADFTIGYPTTIQAQIRLNGLSDEYVSYNISEHNLYKKIYVSCRNSEFGKEVISKINKMLTPEALLTFLDYHEEWNGRDPLFRKTTLDYFVKGKQLDNVVN